MRNWLRTILLLTADVILLSAALVLAFLIRFDGYPHGVPGMFREDFLFVLIAALVVKLACNSYFRLYSSVWRHAGTHELLSIAKAVFISNLLLEVLVLLGITRIPAKIDLLNSLLSLMHAPRSIFIMTIFIDFVFIAAFRFAFGAMRRAMSGESASSPHIKRILIIGGGSAGVSIIREMTNRPGLKSQPVAIIDDDKLLHGKNIRGVPVIGGRELLQKTVKDKLIDEIIIALPSVEKKIISGISAECLKTGCKVKTLPSIEELIDESVLLQKIREVKVEDLLGRDTRWLDPSEFSFFLKNQVVMVTGAGGSIGSALSRQIALYKPKQLILLDNYENSIYDLQLELIDAYPELDLLAVIASVRDKERLEGIFAEHKPKVVFHAAAHKHVPLMEFNPTEAIANNVFGTLNTAECAGKYGAGKFILISTDKAVNPTNIMGASKRLAEMLIQGLNENSRTEYVAVRFGNVLGSNGSVVPLFRKQILNGGPVTVTHPEITRYFMTTSEAAHLVLQAGSIAKGSEIFVLDMGEPVKIYEMAKKMIELSGFVPGKDIEIKFTGLRPGEKLYEELLMAEEGLQVTKFRRIFVAEPVYIDYAFLSAKVAKLKEKIVVTPQDVFELMLEIVPTYKRL